MAIDEVSSHNKDNVNQMPWLAVKRLKLKKIRYADIVFKHQRYTILGKQQISGPINLITCPVWSYQKSALQISLYYQLECFVRGIRNQDDLQSPFWLYKSGVSKWIAHTLVSLSTYFAHFITRSASTTCNQDHGQLSYMLWHSSRCHTKTHSNQLSQWEGLSVGRWRHYACLGSGSSVGKTQRMETNIKCTHMHQLSIYIFIIV